MPAQYKLTGLGVRPGLSVTNPMKVKTKQSKDDMKNLKGKKVTKKEMKMRMKGMKGMKVKPNKVDVKDKKNMIKVKTTKKIRKIKNPNSELKSQQFFNFIILKEFLKKKI